MNSRQELILGIVFAYVIGDMVGLEKSECIYMAGILSIVPMMYVIDDFLKKKDKKPS